ncbi:MAG: YceK/YidQ family lipoprotein [Gemmataceae bacterium]|nr:YceK/YidQ family lipoprotein [Gemmataceae bacterium]
MARNGTMTLAAGLLLFATSGCGTIANVGGRDDWMVIALPTRPPIPFGGVRNDIGIVAKAWQPSAPVPDDKEKRFTPVRDCVVTAGAVSLIAFDMSLSLVADIVTLPWTTYEFTREKLYPTDRYHGLSWLPADPAAPSNQKPSTEVHDTSKSPVADARGSLIR